MGKIKQIIIVGGHEQACNMLDVLVQKPDVRIVLCIARKDDTGTDAIFPSLINRARKYDIPTVQPGSLNSTTIIDLAHRMKPDIVLSLQNNMLFGDAWIELMQGKAGIANVHYAPLPKYAGYWPEMWAIWHQEKHFAVTLHYVAKGVDSGDIIAQKWFDIDIQETRQSLYQKCSAHCFTLLIENLDALINGELIGKAQDQAQRSYFPRSLPNEGFLDLNWDAETQERFLRAISFPGFPGPKIRIGNSVLTVLCEDLPFFKSVKLNS